MEPYEAEPKPSIVKPVIIGGIVGGVLGMIPGVWTCNCCCCLWFAVAGVISVLIYRAMAPYLLTAGMGSLLGLSSGLIAGIVSALVLFLILQPQVTDPDNFDPTSDKTRETVELLRGFYEQVGFPEAEIDKAIDQYYMVISSMTPEQALTNLIVGLFLYIIIGTIAAVIAGLITAAIAGRRRHYPEEPPPYQP